MEYGFAVTVIHTYFQPIVKAIQKRLGRECGVVNEHGGVRFWFDVDK